MKKNGFTLIEVIVSVVLVSIVMISLLGSLIQLRTTYTVIHENSDVIVYSSSISRVINNDFAQNNGIRYVSCDSDGQKCDIILGNDSKRSLDIIRKCTSKDNEVDCDISSLTDEEKEHVKIKTTLKYEDVSDRNDPQLIYIRTLSMDRYEKKGVTTSGYIFDDMSAYWSEHTQNDTETALIDQYTTILIKLNNGVNEDFSKYDITLYAAGRYDYSGLIGKTYSIELNNAGAENPGTTKIDEIFGVGFFNPDSVHAVSSQLRKIEIPKKGSQAFLGYYYRPKGINTDYQVIDSNGRIVASSRFFREDIDINLELSEDKAIILAKWGDCSNGYQVVNGACEPKKYSVTLDKNGGLSSSGTSNYEIDYLSMVPDIQIPKRGGYVFDGYFLGTEKYHENDGKGLKIYNISDNSTFKASWSKCNAGTYSGVNDNTCTKCVSNSVSNAGSSTCTACQGKTTISTDTSTCNGECSNKAHVKKWKTATWNSNNTVTNNCKIDTCDDGYELKNNKCVGKSYTVTYYVGNGTSTAGETELTTKTNCNFGTQCTLKTFSTLGKDFPNKDNGWSFHGWGTSNTTTTKTYDDGAKINPTTYTSNINLYALGQHPIRFYSGIKPATGDANILYQYWNPHSTSEDYITSVKIPSATAISGWTFTGYLVGSNGTTGSVTYAANTVGTSVKPAINNSGYYRGVYNRTLTVSYNANGGSGTTSATTLTQYYNTGWNNSDAISSHSIKLANNNFTKTGYTFNKWAEGSTSGTQYSQGVSYTGIGTKVDDTTVSKTMYALWNGNTYTVTYNKNNASSIGKVSDSCTVSNTAGNCTVTATTITAKTGFTTVGWNSSSTANTSQYNVNSSITLTGNITLNAITHKNITVNGAVSEIITISRKDASESYGTITTDTKGQTSVNLPEGEYTFTSNLAKVIPSSGTITDSTAAYSKTFTVTTATTTLNFYPNTAVIWFGNGLVENSSLYATTGGVKFHKNITPSGLTDDWETSGNYNPIVSRYAKGMGIDWGSGSAFRDDEPGYGATTAMVKGISMGSYSSLIFAARSNGFWSNSTDDSYTLDTSRSCPDHFGSKVLFTNVLYALSSVRDGYNETGYKIPSNGFPRTKTNGVVNDTYGFNIIRITGLSGKTVYPALYSKTTYCDKGESTKISLGDIKTVGYAVAILKSN